MFDPDLRGYWILNVAKSDFGSGEKPKSGLVNWTERGFVFAIVNADGSLYADSVMIDHGCSMVGVPSSFSCQLKVIEPRHLQLIVRDAQRISRVAEIELLDSNTTRTTHRVTPEKGAPYVEKTIWERQKN